MAKKKGSHRRKTGKTVGTPFDDAFRSMYTRCGKLVLFLLNEAFGTTYVGDEKIQFLPNEAFSPRGNSGSKKLRDAKRISDSHFEVTDHAGNKRCFQIECQSRADTNMS